MKTYNIEWLLGVLFAIAPGASGFAHGLLPIVVSLQNGTLSIAGGTHTINGYAANVFADPDEQAPLVPLPNNSDLLFTSLPAFKLNGLAVNSGLFLEAVPRK